LELAFAMIEIDLIDLERSKPKSARETDVANWSIGQLCKLILTDAERRGADQIRIEPEQIQGEKETAVIPSGEGPLSNRGKVLSDNTWSTAVVCGHHGKVQKLGASWHHRDGSSSIRCVDR